jgi:hypothetical protein
MGGVPGYAAGGGAPGYAAVGMGPGGSMMAWGEPTPIGVVQTNYNSSGMPMPAPTPMMPHAGAAMGHDAMGGLPMVGPAPNILSNTPHHRKGMLARLFDWSGGYNSYQYRRFQRENAMNAMRMGVPASDLPPSMAYGEGRGIFRR